MDYNTIYRYIQHHTTKYKEKFDKKIPPLGGFCLFSCIQLSKTRQDIRMFVEKILVVFEHEDTSFNNQDKEIKKVPDLLNGGARQLLKKELKNNILISRGEPFVM